MHTEEYSYTRFGDLFYYLLAHMHIDLAADVYDHEYIDRMKDTLGVEPQITDEMICYYQEHFDRVAVINFVALIAEDEEQFRNILVSMGMLTDEDMDVLVDPLLEVCRELHEPFCSWWDQHHASVSVRAEIVKRNIDTFKERYTSFFEHLSMKVKVIFSYSLRKNGRAFGDGEALNIYLPFPEKEADEQGCFFQLLHECTHTITDPLLEQEIMMGDGSHDMAEYQVLCYDEYLIAGTETELLEEYCTWIGQSELEKAHEALGKTGETRLKDLL